MTPEQWGRVNEVWHAVLARPEPDRPALLAELCAGDDVLRRDVESLLQHLSRASHAGFGAAVGVVMRAPLKAGTRLGPYQIGNSIGAGGMGEVYRARDTRLGRDVAVKVLPADLAHDPARLRRFEQEARAAAALNHPNVLAVYDVGAERIPLLPSDATDGGTVDVSFIVTELLEGRTLRQVLSDEQLSVGAAVELGSQIADGLAAAHSRGIVHRDLKPENLFVTTDGHVKILDFGLADAVSTASAAAEAHTRTDTEPHLVMGTPGYMAPEQARGQRADHRADVFAFGAVLFEMLTGRRAFEGATVLDRMSAALRDAPAAALSTAERPIPPPIVRIVERCLDKQPTARFQSTNDLAFALKALNPLDTGTNAAVQMRVSGVPTSRWARALPWVIAAGLAVAIAAVWRPLASPAETTTLSPVVFTIGEPAGASFGTRPPLLPYPALSPDGRHLVFVASKDGGPRQLWLRDMDSADARPLPGTDSARMDFGMQPFWSTDSRSIAFVSESTLKRIDLDDGRVKDICGSLADFVGGTWSRDGTIVFSGGNEGLWRVPASGGEPVRIYAPDHSRRERTLGRPQFLPDGQRFTFLPYPGDAVMVGSLDGREPKVLVKGDSAAYYDPEGYLVYARGGSGGAGTLLAHRFDPDTLEVSGDPTTLATDVLMGLNGAAFTISSNGFLVYRTTGMPEGESAPKRLTWFDRHGAVLQAAREPLPFNGFHLFPDGHRVLMAMSEGLQSNPDLYVLNLDSGDRTRTTLDPASDTDGIVSPDGASVIWQRWTGDGSPVLYRKATNGTGSESVLGTFPADLRVLSAWSDGWVVVTVFDPQTEWDVWYFDPNDLRSAKPYLRTMAGEEGGQLSPELAPGRRVMAFTVIEAGRRRVYIRPFPNAEDGVWQVPGSESARIVRWRRDGKELYFKTATHMMAVNVSLSGGSVAIGSAHALFPLSAGIGSTTTFAVSSDGEKFLLPVREGTDVAGAATEVRPLTAVLNWKRLLKP